MKIIIQSKKVNDLTKKEINIMNAARIKEYGDIGFIDFKKEDKVAEFFFVKENNRIVSFGMLKPVEIEYLNKKYFIFGIGRGLTIEKGKEYGRILNAIRIHYLKKTGKTGLAFTDKKNIEFFKKVGYNVSKNLIKRFRYKNPTTDEIIMDMDGDGVYYEGKDKLISKILSEKYTIAYTNVPFW